VNTKIGGPPESVVRALSSSDRANTAKAVAALIEWGSSEIDHALSKRTLRLLRRVMRVLMAALPDTDQELIGGVCADLLDLWQTGQTLDKKLRELCHFRFPRDRARLQDALVWIEAIQLDMASYWIGEVKKDLPKLLKALDKLERRSVSGRSKR